MSLPTAEAAEVRHCQRQRHCQSQQHAPSDDTLSFCSYGDCSNSIHASCYSDILFLKSLEPLHDEQGRELVICKKGCYSAIKRSLDRKAARQRQWRLDSRNGETDFQKSSEGILLQWLTTNDNYKNYVHVTHARKMQWCREIAQLMNSNGVTAQRTREHVREKIALLENQYRNARNWLNDAGQGIKDEKTLKAAVKDKCPLYYELAPVMEEFASSKISKEQSSDEDDHSISRKGDAPMNVITFAQGKKAASRPRVDLGDDDDDDASMGQDSGGGDTRKSRANRQLTPSRKKRAPLDHNDGESSVMILEHGRDEVAGQQRKHRDEGSKEVQEKKQKLELEQSEVNLTQSKLELEKRQLEVEKRRLEMEKHRLEVAQLQERTQREGILEKIETYEKLKERGWGDAKIMRVFPTLKTLIESMQGE